MLGGHLRNTVDVTGKGRVTKFLCNIQSDLKWHQHIQSVVNKSNKTLFVIIRCLFNASTDIKLIAFNTVFEYASRVWSPHTKKLIEQLETIQRRAVRWIFKLERLDGVTDCMLENGIEELEIRRQDLDLKLLRKIEFGHYDVDLSNYVSFNLSYLTRHGTVNPHFGSDQFKFSFFNRMRPMVTRTDFNDTSTE